MTFPLIGIPCGTDKSLRPKHPQVFTVPLAYLEAIQGAGGTPLQIPLGLSPAALEELAARLDGLLLAGGADIAPGLYGAQRRPETKAADDKRDATELTLIHWALAHDQPLLATCRGAQMLNVAAGGTLYQDIRSECPFCLEHDRYYPEHPLDEQVQAVEVVAGSRLADILGERQLQVNTRHHQALRELGAGLVVSGRAPDGIVEAIELPGRRFVVGVQWHPENLVAAQASMGRLFRALVDACRASL